MRLILSTLLLTACGNTGLVAFNEAVQGGAASALEIEPQGQVVFNDVGADTGGDTQVVDLRSTGNATVAVIDVYLDDLSSSAFELPPDLPLPLRLQPGEDFPVEVSFYPYAVGHFAGTLVVEVELDGQVVERTRDLDGDGCDPAAAGCPS